MRDTTDGDDDSMHTSASFGEWLKAQRARKRLTLRVFAKKAGLDPGNLSRYERSVVPPPQDHAVLERIGRALGLKPQSATCSNMVHLSAIGGRSIPREVADDPQ